MPASLAPIYLDNNRVFLQGEPKPRISQIVAAGGKHPDAVEVERVRSQTDPAGSRVGQDDVIDRTANSQPIYLRTVGRRGLHGWGGEGEGVPSGDVRIEGGEPVARGRRGGRQEELTKPGGKGRVDTLQTGAPVEGTSTPRGAPASAHEREPGAEAQDLEAGGQKRQAGGRAEGGAATGATSTIDTGGEGEKAGTVGSFETGRDVVRGSYAMETQLQGGAGGELEDPNLAPRRPSTPRSMPTGAQGPLTSGPGEGPSKQAPYGEAGETGGTTGARSSRQATREAGERFTEAGKPGEKGGLDAGTTSKSQGSYGAGSGWGAGLGEGANRTPERQAREARYRPQAGEDEGAGEREAEEREIPETGAGRLGTGIAEPARLRESSAGSAGALSDLQDMEASPAGRRSGRSNREYEEEHGPVRPREPTRASQKADSDSASDDRSGPRHAA